MHDALKRIFNRLFHSERTPPIGDILSLGKALLDAHLGFLIEKDLLGRHYEATTAMNLVYAAVRVQHPLQSQEELARVNDHGYLQDTLDAIEQRGQWPTVKGELVKLSKLVFQELKARTPDAPSGPPLTEIEEKVLALIQQQPPGKGITGKAIVARLGKVGLSLEQSTLTTHIIPKLKRHHGVRNRRGVGYFIESA